MAKVDGFVRPYRGHRDDLEAFWQKFEVTAALQKWDSDEKKMQNLPLFLEDEAFTVWSEMTTADKKVPKKVKDQLQDAFGLTAAQAYRLFGKRVLNHGEAIDTYAADLKKLLKLSGQEVGADGKNRVVIEQFISGLPSDFARQLRMSSKTETIGECVKFVRDLRSAERASGTGIRSQAADEVTAATNTPYPGSQGERKRTPGLCYNCHQTGHFARNCPELSRSGLGRGSSVTCHFCDKKGHVVKDCRELKELKARRKGGVDTTAAAVSRDGPEAGTAPSPDAVSSDDEACLCVPEPGGDRVPRIFVDVQADGAVRRAKAAVDTCSSRSLITQCFADAMSLAVEPSYARLIAVDGKPLTILGQVHVTLSRKDDAVSLLETTATLLVVRDLASVRADVIIGQDLITKGGGVSLQYSEGKLVSVMFGHGDVAAAASATCDREPDRHPLRHVDVSYVGSDDVVLKSDDVAVRWRANEHRWELTWVWKDDIPPTFPIGSGISEYPRSKLTHDQEALFSSEVQKWLENGWLVEYDVEKHGEPMCVLPLIAQAQEHKETTPVRPVLDYRLLNEHILSHPGLDSPACDEALRRWRQAGQADTYSLIDIRKAYLQVHVAPELQRYQVVVWQDKTYVLARMGFGLSVAPKAMDLIVKWVTRDIPAVDNYVDDLYVPDSRTSDVTAKMSDYGLPTKPAAPVTGTRVLGLEVRKGLNGSASWKRRDGVDLALPDKPTKRDIFRWCGRLTGHYPVCNWLRPACGYVKRLAGSSELGWDEPVSDATVKCGREISARLAQADPVTGVWYVDPTSNEWTVWCDASSIAIGAVLSQSGNVVEDGAWLRSKDDKRHINVAELEAAMKGIELAVRWNVSRLKLITDSKTVAGWLQSVFDNTRRVKVGGLQEVLVRLRLQTIADTVDATGMDVSVEWVKSESNLADRLTRVPSSWPRYPLEDDVVAALPSGVVEPSLSIARVRSAQEADDDVKQIKEQISSDEPVCNVAFKKYQGQLRVLEGLLCRVWLDPLDGEMCVPVIPSCLQYECVDAAHRYTGHGNWEATWKSLKRRCFFPAMSVQCQQHVQNCQACRVANPAGGVPQSARQDLPSQPWEVVQIDTLELGASHSGRYHCVLVAVDMFTRWAEVIPLRRHDASSVADAFVEMCTRWGPPRVIRCDNGTEFCNSIVTSLFKVFGVNVRHGAVRHPQSQGGAERFNRTLINLIRKTVSAGGDWASELQMMGFYYRNRPHSQLGISPMQAMLAWEPRNLIVESIQPEERFGLDTWVTTLHEKAARVRDLVTEELANADVEQPETAAYNEGDKVLLRRPARSQKCVPPFEAGWYVNRVISPTTLVIARSDDNGY